jgi:vacuolar protein sorting-associated protein 13A/C
MGLRNVLISLLEENLGGFIDGLGKKNLHLKIRKGEIKLSDLIIRTHALDKLKLPIVVKHGCIKHFRMSIPWNKLGSEPVRIFIDEISILAVPLEREEWDHDQALNHARRQKKREIRWNELQQRAEETERKAHGGKRSKGRARSFFAALLTRVIDNVQISISNVHIRYEDVQMGDRFRHQDTMKNQFVAAGVILKHFEMHTVDANGQKSFKGKAKRKYAKGKAKSAKGTGLDFTHKLCQISGMAVYSTKGEQASSYTRLGEELHQRLQDDIQAYLNPVEGDNPRKEALILDPWSPQLRLTKNEAADSAGSDKRFPRYSVSCQCDRTHLRLSQDQCHDLMHIQESFSVFEDLQQFFPYRPKQAVTAATALLWWKYAVHCVSSTLQNKMKKQRMEQW